MLFWPEVKKELIDFGKTSYLLPQHHLELGAALPLFLLTYKLQKTLVFQKILEKQSYPLERLSIWMVHVLRPCLKLHLFLVYLIWISPVLIPFLPPLVFVYCQVLSLVEFPVAALWGN